MRIKGILLIGTKEFIVRNYGEKKWEEFLKTLPDHIAEPLSKIILPGGLYDLELYTTLNLETDRYFGTGDGKPQQKNQWNFTILSLKENLKRLQMP